MDMTKDNPVAAGVAKYANDGANKHYCSDRAVSEMLAASPVQAGIDPLVAEIEAGLEGVTPFTDADVMRYDHGGARIAILRDGERRLVADTYHEADSEHFARCSPDNIAKLIAGYRSQAERIAALEVERDDYKSDYLRRHKDAVDHMTRAIAAESLLAEAREALEKIEKARRPCCPFESRSLEQMTALDPKGLEAAYTRAAKMSTNTHICNKSALAEVIAAYLSTAPSGQAPLEGVKSIINRVLREHAGPEHGLAIGEGGCPRVDWYALRNELVAALLPASAEPVAWMNADHVKDYRDKTADGIAWASPQQTVFYSVPLYASPPASGAVEAGPAFTTGHCENNQAPGGCQLHNLHCGWPDCDRRPAAPTEGR